MNFLRIILLVFASLVLSACKDCGCSEVDTNIYSDAQSADADLVLFADGCASSTGEIVNAVPAGNCDSTGQYVNRGKWVKVPNIVPEFNSIVNIRTEGSLYFCSTGYDNQNPSPTMTIPPSTLVKYSFDDGSKLPVMGGEEVAIVMAAGGSAGFTALSGSSATANCASLSTPYTKLLTGQCKAYNGFGLTIYVGDKKLITLDQTDNSSDPYQYYSSASRTFNMYNMVPSNELEDFYNQVKAKYNKDISGQGSGKFVFLVPDGLKGNLGFILADGRASQGNGGYSVQVNSTPNACYVENAQASNIPDNRGAVELVISAVNPNDYDNAISAMNIAIVSWATSDYYDQLIAYINSFAGLSKSGSVSALNSLVVDSAETSLAPLGLNPLLITTSDYLLDTVNNYGGNIWLKVRDDYYSDNIGHYKVKVKYTFAGETSSIVSKLLNKLITPIVDNFTNLSHQIYANFGSRHFLNIVRMSLMIYIMVYGVQFALGLTKISAYDLLFRIIKIGVVVELFDVANSWSFFNTYFFQFFQSGMNSLISYVTGDYTANKIGIFGFVDGIFSIFFAKQTWIKLLALGPHLVGIFYMIAIIQIMALYILILARAIVAYLLVIVGIALLISLAPIFFVLLLFKKTKSYFDNWIARLVDYALQPILMFGALSILTSFFILFWNSLMDFNVCWGSILNMNFTISKIGIPGVDIPHVGSTGFSTTTIPIPLGCVVFYNVKGGLNNLLGMFSGILVLGIFTQAINNLMSHIPDITSAITSVGSANQISQAANRTVQQGIDTAGIVYNWLENKAKKGGNLVSNITRKLAERNGMDIPGKGMFDSLQNIAKKGDNSVSNITRKLGNRPVPSDNNKLEATPKTGKEITSLQRGNSENRGNN